MVVLGFSMCLFPVRATRQEFGRPKLDKEGDLTLPCGKCTECISKRAHDWALRCKHEISMHDENCFITLTYDDEHLPSFLVVKDYFQKFMKRLRKKTKKKLKYIVSHEYGSRTGRPHHHAIIFGWTPSNQEFALNSPSGEPLYTSKELGDLWRFGYHSIGDANEKTAYYIASYSLKSHTRTVTNPDSGEVVTVSDSMDCSRRPAIGREYFEKNMNQLLDSNVQLPRYYQKLLEKNYPDHFERYENESMLRNVSQRGIHERLAKHVIDTQKKEFACSGFRSAPESRQAKSLIDYLKEDREAYKLIVQQRR